MDGSVRKTISNAPAPPFAKAVGATPVTTASPAPPAGGLRGAFALTVTFFGSRAVPGTNPSLRALRQAISNSGVAAGVVETPAPALVWVAPATGVPAPAARAEDAPPPPAAPAGAFADAPPAVAPVAPPPAVPPSVPPVGEAPPAFVAAPARNSFSRPSVSQ